MTRHEQRQEAYDRRHAMLRMKDAGLSVQTIAQTFGISDCRVYELLGRAEYDRKVGRERP